MRTQPAAFLKLLVLLVPREMKVEHSGGVNAMSDEQLEAGIEAIQRHACSSGRRGECQGDRSGGRVAIAWRVGGSDTSPDARKATRDMGRDMGSAPDGAD